MHTSSRIGLLLSLGGLTALGCSAELVASPRDAEVRDAGPRGDAAEPEVDASVVDAMAAVDAGPVCESAAPSEAMVLDGVDDGATMGVASGLGLAELTVEAWVRRDGKGVATGTGVGGISVVPIAGKGRGEDDGSNVDCNYAFGFVGDVLGADFEDMASGANHPVLGRSRVPRGEWHHVAATYDGTTWRLYLDGELDGEARANATPRADSIQHFGVGTAFNSMGVAAGRLHGAIAELRVWDRARAQEELARDRFVRVTAGEGLVGRWPFHGAEGLADTIGEHPATVIGGRIEAGGPVLERGVPPTIDAAVADDAELDTSAPIELAIDVVDAEGEPVDVTFHLREITEVDDFTIAVLPDTQYYTVESRALDAYFHAQTRWIVENRETYGIAAVIHNGDIVNNGDSQIYQWRVADAAMSRLEDVAALPDGIPFGVAVGNHDLSVVSEVGPARRYNEFFGRERFLGRTYYGGSRTSSDNNDSWFTFTAGGLEFVVVNLQFDPEPSAAMLAFARRIFETHPDAFGILNAHYILTGAGNFSAQGAAIYAALRDVPNLHVMTCGHVSNEQRRVDTFEGHPILSMLADYQSRENGGNGWMRLWELSPANGEMTVRTYSPMLDRFETDANSEFTVSLDLRGAGTTEFEEIARVDDAAARVAIEVEGLEPGRIYEWYASARDCDHEARTPVRRFTTR